MPCNYKDYDPEWKKIRAEILLRADGRCELCNAENYKPHWKTKSKVVLTIAHIDQDKTNNKRYNLLALCQRCHNKIDLPYRVKNRKRGKREI
jgi:5-methylcytosine-specific restriction endonuclease McrA